VTDIRAENNSQCMRNEHSSKETECILKCREIDSCILVFAYYMKSMWCIFPIRYFNKNHKKEKKGRKIDELG
jgi:hypothetical protein